MPPQPPVPGVEFPLLKDLAVTLMIAGAVTFLFHRLRMPVIFGYLIAGVIIGPFTPPFAFVTQIHVINALADIGIVLLLFYMGMQFSFIRLRQVGPGVVLAGILEVLLPFVVLYYVGRLVGLSVMESVLLAAALSFTSTAIVSKVLADLHKLNEPFVRVVFGMSIIDDMIAIAFLALVASLGQAGSNGMEAVGLVALKLVVFGAVSLVLGTAIVPRILSYVERTGSTEMMLLVVLGLGFGMAFLALQLGLSVAVGAFTMGSVIAVSDHRENIQTVVRPVRDVFAALFFVAVGMLVDPSLVVKYWYLVLLFGALFIICKVAAASLGVFLGGFGVETALRSGLGMVAVGEFAFVIAKMGQETSAAGPFLYPVVVAISLITTLVLPYLIKASDPLCEGWEHRMPPKLRAFVLSAEGMLKRLQRSGRGEDATARALRRSLARLVINFLLIALVAVLARVLLDHRISITQTLRVDQDMTLLLIVLAVAVLAIAPVYSIWQNVRLFLSAGVELILRNRGAGHMLGRRMVRRFLTDGLAITIALAMGAIFLLLASQSSEFSNIAPLLILGLVASVALYVAIDAFRLFHRRVERLFWLTLIGRADLEKDTEDEVEKNEGAETKTTEE